MNRGKLDVRMIESLSEEELSSLEDGASPAELEEIRREVKERLRVETFSKAPQVEGSKYVNTWAVAYWGEYLH